MRKTSRASIYFDNPEEKRELIEIAQALTFRTFSRSYLETSLKLFVQLALVELEKP